MLIGRPSTSVPFNSNAFCACSGVSKSTYPKPLGRPESRSVMIRAETRPPIDSKMLASHSWSMFHERLPTKMLTEPVDSGLERLLGVSVAEGASLRFWLTAGLASSSSSEDSSSSSSESSSDSSSDDSSFLALAVLVPLALAAFLGASSSSDSSSESSSDSSESSSDELSPLRAALAGIFAPLVLFARADFFGTSSSDDSSSESSSD
jgi:hypothetical protein